MSDHGFALVDLDVDPPLHKQYPQPEVAAGDSRWDLLALARAEGRPIGYAATTWSAWNRRQVLDELHVDPSWRRRGIGRRLVAEIFAEASRNQAREVWLETQNVNYPAILAYRRLGFRVTGLDTTLYDGRADAEVAVFMSSTVQL